MNALTQNPFASSTLILPLRAGYSIEAPDSPQDLEASARLYRFLRASEGGGEVEVRHFIENSQMVVEAVIKPLRAPGIVAQITRRGKRWATLETAPAPAPAAPAAKRAAHASKTQPLALPPAWRAIGDHKGGPNFNPLAKEAARVVREVFGSALATSSLPPAAAPISGRARARFEKRFPGFSQVQRPQPGPR